MAEAAQFKLAIGIYHELLVYIHVIVFYLGTYQRHWFASRSILNGTHDYVPTVSLVARTLWAGFTPILNGAEHELAADF